MLALPAFVGPPALNRVYNVDAMTLLRAMPDEKGMSLNVLAVHVGVAMHPTVTRRAESNEVVCVHSQGGVSCPRLDVVSVQGATHQLLFAAPDASIVVTRVHVLDERTPFASRIDALPFRRTPVAVVRMCRAASAVHAILSASDMRFGLASRSGQLCTCIVRVTPALKRVFRSSPLHVAVLAFQVFSTRTSFNPISGQPRVDLLRIAAHKGCDVIGAQSFDAVLLAQPTFINRLLSSLPTRFAVERAEASRLAPLADDFVAAPLAV